MAGSPRSRDRRGIWRRRKPAPRVLDLALAGPSRGKSHRLFTEAAIAICNNVDVRVWAPRGWPEEPPMQFPEFVSSLEQSPPTGGLVVVDELDYLYLNTPYTLTEARSWITRLVEHATTNRYTVLAAISYLTPHINDFLPAVATMSIETGSLGPASLPPLRLSLNRWLGEQTVDRIDFRGTGSASKGAVLVLDTAGSAHWSPPVPADIVTSVAAESDTLAADLASIAGRYGTRVVMGQPGSGIPLRVIRRAAQWQTVDLPRRRRILLDSAGFDPSAAFTYECTSIGDDDLERLEGYRDEIDEF